MTDLIEVKEAALKIEAKLLPCPCCGGSGRIGPIKSTVCGYHIECSRCTLVASDPQEHSPVPHTSMKRAAEVWNRREPLSGNVEIPGFDPPPEDSMINTRWREECPHCKKDRELRKFKIKLCGEDVWCRACEQCKARLEKDDASISNNSK